MSVFITHILAFPVIKAKQKATQNNSKTLIEIKKGLPDARYNFKLDSKLISMSPATPEPSFHGSLCVAPHCHSLYYAGIQSAWASRQHHQVPAA